MRSRCLDLQVKLKNQFSRSFETNGLANRLDGSHDKFNFELQSRLGEFGWKQCEHQYADICS